jgi:uncharacterized membrane protein
VDYDVVELNGPVGHADLQKAICAGGLANLDVVVIVLAIHVGLAQVNPISRVGRRGNVQDHS